jgi:hypothetical protein
MKRQQIARDACLVASLPVVSFVEMRLTPKACGHCAHCRSPVCGACKTCVLNAKLGPEKTKDRRRCEALTCIRIVSKQRQTASEQPAPDPEATAAELSSVSAQLVAMGSKRGAGGFDGDLYRTLVDRKKHLHAAKTSIKARKSKNRTPFPTGAHEAWGVVSCLEKIRQKFSKFVVKNSGSDGCRRTVTLKREMRDELDAIILQWCERFSDVVAPINEEDEFLRLLSAPRESEEIMDD